MKLTHEEVREWFLIRDHVRRAVQRLEVCNRCWRVRDEAHLIRIAQYRQECVHGLYCCRPDDEDGCLGSNHLARTLRLAEAIPN